jgi:serine/threonine protein kinase/formylglycine-generating enzyme required for sulfatase activity
VAAINANPLSHPPRDTLERFTLGSLSSEESELIAAHLETCVTCSTVAYDECSGTDSFAARLGALAQEHPAVLGAAALEDGKPALPAAPRDYALLEKLGEGGMGAVYRARHLRLDKVVALKVLPAGRMRDRESVARFQREMKAIGRLDHPHIVRAMDAGEENGMHYLVMEYVEGTDLSRLARSVGPLPIADACELVRQAALGLQEAHDHGMVHRDIKPSNLILAHGRKKTPPTVKILDLGLALLSDSRSAGAEEITDSGQLMGTLDYMAPEQVGDTHQVDIRADIYSLGATLYRLVTGAAPFADRKFDAPARKILALATQAPRAIAGVRPQTPSGVIDIIDKMLAKQPHERFSTPDEVAAALAPFCQSANLTDLLARAGAVRGGERSGTRPASPSDTAPTSGLDSVAARPAARPDKPPPAAAAAGPAATGAVGNRRFKAVAALLGLAACLVLATVFFLQTPQGTVRIEIDDPEIQVVLDKQGATIRGADTMHEIKLEPGPHGITITRGDFSFETTRFELKKGDVTTLKIEYLAGAIQVIQDGKVLAKEMPPLADDRAVAQHVLSLGGRVLFRKDDQDFAYAATDPLPDQPGTLIVIEFNRVPEVIDLQRLLAARDLVSLDLVDTRLADQTLAHVREWPRLQRLCLTGRSYDQRSLKQLGHVPLLGLNLGDSTLDDAAVEEVVKLRSLTYLAVDNTRINDRAVELIAALPALEELRLSNTSVTGAVMKYLAAAPRLQHLAIHNSHLSDNDLTDLPKFKRLRILALNESKSLRDGCCPPIRAAEWLQEVGLSFTGVGDKGVAELAGHPGLRSLGLAGTAVTSDSLPHLASMPNLRHLSLDSTSVLNRNLSLLVKLPLEELGLSGTSITNEGVKSLEGLTSLTKVSFADTSLTDASIDSLIKIHTLRECNLIGTLITATGIARLKQALPECTVAWDETDAASPPAAPANGPEPPPAKLPTNRPTGAEFTNSIGMRFCLIPGGHFNMGLDAAQVQELMATAGGDEHLRDCVQSAALEHRVVISQPFYLSVHEVTQKQYAAVMGANPSHFASSGAGKESVAGIDTSNCPVEMVSWNDAVEFCFKLSEQEGLQPVLARNGQPVTIPAGSGYRLPTEAEWEYACRARTTTRYWTGDDTSTFAKAAWHQASSEGRTQIVGELQANPFGLFDMHGNVGEWVHDKWGKEYYSQFTDEHAVDPRGPGDRGAPRGVRGGAWHLPAAYHFAGMRGHAEEGGTSQHVGFRVAIAAMAGGPN